MNAEGKAIKPRQGVSRLVAILPDWRSSADPRFWSYHPPHTFRGAHLDLELAGTVVLITGGSKGIGLACARAFAREGARIAIASRSAANLDRARATLAEESIETFTVAADLRDSAQAREMVRKVEEGLGAVGVLVNSAGAAVRTPPHELSAEHWRAAMEAKYFTYIYAVDAVLPRMLERGGGVIVNIVGMGGKQPSPIHLPGGAANAALMLASSGLGHAFAGKNIRVNAVNPGATLTERLQEGIAADARVSGTTPAETLALRTRQHPMGRFSEPREIADVVVFLASKRASYVNGAVISLDGGATPMVV
jgi:NAD(P)-dependent dehydrogenase (short-subunit alcohol dehydrogenase family)